MKNRKNSKGQAKSQKKAKRGFTLVEILIVVAIIGILFISLVPRIDFAGDKARETGVKTDFRSFELAAEQLIREKAGLADFDDVAELCGDSGINLYLDDDMQFNTSGSSLKDDPWNQWYDVQIAKDSDSDNPNNGAIIFLSSGRDGLFFKTEDNYALTVAFVDGKIMTETIGFSTNIDSDNISAYAAGAPTFEYDETTKLLKVGYGY